MRKNVFGRRFKRDKDQRKALFKSLMSSLVLKERIKTTEAKAKSIRSQIEKLVTKAKKREDDAKRFLSSFLTEEAMDKVIERIAPQFAKRPGGYTRIIHVSDKRTDSAPMVIMEWTETIQNSKFLPALPVRQAGGRQDKFQNSKRRKTKQVRVSKTLAGKKIAVKKSVTKSKSVKKKSENKTKAKKK